MNRKINTSKDMEESKHFCILPWIHSHILPDSTVLPCCVSDFSEPYGHLNQKTMNEVWNGEKFNNMRLKMLEDKPVKSCKNCYQLEAGDMHSMRHRMNRLFSHHIADLGKTKADGSFPEIKMRYLDIRFSNLCNFKCRGCSPFCSSQWFDDYQSLWGENINSNKLVSLEMTKDKNLNELDSYLETLEIAYFAGGEPLMMDEHYYCLQKLIALNKDIPLHYNSNLSVLKFKKYDLIELWKNFSYIDLNISLDDIEQRGEYFRHGLDWEKFKKHIIKIQNELPHVTFQVTCTISLFNIHRIPEIHQEMMSLSIIGGHGFTLNPLQDPIYYRTQVLPLSDKEKVKDKLTHYSQTLNERYPGFDWEFLQSSIKGVINLMNQADLSHELPTFKKVTLELDKLRSESFKEVFPELSHILDSRFMIFAPLKDQETRIQPLMRELEKEILPHCDLIFFIDESSHDNTKSVLDLELPHLKTDHKLITLDQDKGRGFSFKIALDYAKENHFDYILTIEEGWEDCIKEFGEIVRNKSFCTTDLLIGRRNSQRMNLGSLIDKLSNFLTGIIGRRIVYETKGDGMNFVRVMSEENSNKYLKIPTHSNYFYTLLLNCLATNKKIEYTSRDNGINYRTRVKLNTKRLVYILSSLLQYTFKKLLN